MIYPAYDAVVALDRRLEQLARRTRDPLVAQMRLTWWFEALGALDAGTVPAEPLFEQLAAEVLPRGVTGAALAEMASGWEVVLEPRPLPDEALCRFARQRGETLFAAVGALLGTTPPAAAGEAWALADFAASIDGEERARARDLAEARWRDATMSPWPAAARPMGVLTLLALLPLRSRDGTAGGLGAAWRVARFRLTGR
ncbi:phytoene synthase [Sphingomonas jinjuensis]|uniref:Phytoene synthase n=1 Tax=Sphingomonas jinjuensis TaxID=535907 RepID=A0A840FC67_9SPHN|nr:hypothetical protein [Sphingomonas jinjuensis]MBB4154242.1 phytoene synthase [Sphingomonas jinjuensis]